MAIVLTDDKHYKNIANKIREIKQTNETMFPNEITENVQLVFEKGVADGNKLGNLLEESNIGLLTVPYINPNEHKIEVKLSSDTITDFSAVKVKVLGENILPYPYADTTKTVNGITFTDNGDGTITANGTATADATFRLCVANTINYTGTRKLFLFGCPSGGGSATYRIRMSFSANMQDTGNGYFYDAFYPYEINPIIEIKSGTTVNNLVFKPQLTRKDRTLYDTYTPYSATEYTANSNGVVEIQHSAPTINLLTDKGITITCKSYKVNNYDWHEFWDSYQECGFRWDWLGAFAYGWKGKSFNPKYPIIGASSYGLREAFRNSSGITEIKVPIIDRVGNLQATFNYCNNLKRISLLKLEKPLTTVGNAFTNCYALKEITIEGEIAITGLSFSYSSKLNHDSIVSIINALSTTTTGLTITLSLTAVNNAFETSEGAVDGSTSAEWSALIATRSNWTISLV